jgi:hypothetical protein
MKQDTQILKSELVNMARHFKHAYNHDLFCPSNLSEVIEDTELLIFWKENLPQVYGDFKGISEYQKCEKYIDLLQFKYYLKIPGWSLN